MDQRNAADYGDDNELSLDRERRMMYAVDVGRSEEGGNKMETVMKSRVMWIALAAVSLAALGTGCGDDGESKAEEPVEEEPEELPEGAVVCGPATCESPGDWFTGELCCRSAFDGTCGSLVGGTCLDLPMPPDERCENGKFSGAGMEIEISSCCTDDNECGLRFEFGGGSMCTSITQAMRFGRMQMVGGGNQMVRVMGTLPPAKMCTGEPIESSMPAAGSGG
jgi:hypothetical protein